MYIKESKSLTGEPEQLVFDDDVHGTELVPDLNWSNGSPCGGLWWALAGDRVTIRGCRAQEQGDTEAELALGGPNITSHHHQGTTLSSLICELESTLFSQPSESSGRSDETGK